MKSVRVKALYVTVPRTPTTGIRTASVGQTVSVSDEVAERWVRLGAAELVDEPQGSGVGSAETEPPKPVIVQVDGQDVDLAAIEDADKLREIAGKLDGLEIPGNVKKPETLRERIAEHVAAQGSGVGDE